MSTDPFMFSMDMADVRRMGPGTVCRVVSPMINGQMGLPHVALYLHSHQLTDEAHSPEPADRVEYYALNMQEAADLAKALMEAAFAAAQSVVAPEDVVDRD